jgi:hypothetical protein
MQNAELLGVKADGKKVTIVPYKANVQLNFGSDLVKIDR